MRGYKRRIIRRIQALILAVLLCIPCLEAKTVDAAPKEKITVMSNIGKEIMEPYLEAFEKKYPDICVKYCYYSDYETDMKEKAAEDDLGDVLFVPGCISTDEYSQRFEKLGNYEELADKYYYMEGSKYIEDDVYGIPSSAYLVGILYNKEVFNKAGITETPKSMDDFMQDLYRIKNRTDAVPFYLNYSAGWPLQFWETFTYLEMTGDPDYRNNGFLYDKNPFSTGSYHYQVYKLLYDIVNQHLSEGDLKTDDWEKSKGMLNEGEIGCTAIGSWAIQQFEEAGDNGDNIGFMPFPNTVNGKQYMTISTDYCYAINAKSEHKEAARAYINFMLDESGYALDQQNLSILKTDPYPDIYAELDNVELAMNKQATTKNAQRKAALSQNLNLEDYAQAVRVIDAAAGYSDENFDEIMEDWNTRWEAARPADMEDELKDSAEDNVIGSRLPKQYELELSLTEKEYINSQDFVKVGYLKNLAPFQYEKDEEFCGLSRELLDQMSAMVDIKFEYVGFDSQTKLMEALENGDIQMAAGVDPDSYGNGGVYFSKSYMDYMKVIVKNDTVEVEDLSGKKPAYVEGDLEKPEGKAVRRKTFPSAIKAVDAGEADYVLGNFYSADYYLKALECEHATIIPMSDQGSMAFGFYGGTDTRMLSISNKCLYGIGQSQIQVMLMDNLDPPPKEITVTQFIRARPMLVVGVILFIIALIVLTWFIVLRQKWLSARTHAVDVKRYEILATLTDEYIFEYDDNSRILLLDGKAAERFHVARQIDMALYRKEYPWLNELIERFKEMMENQENESKPFQMEQEDGVSEWYRLVVHSLENEGEKKPHVIGKLVNIQKEIEDQQRMLDRAQKDPLTGLYNRKRFSKEFEKIEPKESIAYAVLDIDNFKQVNDTLGHAGGDEALKCLAGKIRNIFKGKVIYGRFGGDEFVICTYDMSREKVESLFEKLVQEMKCKLEYQGKEKDLSISLGAVYRQRKLPLETLLKDADAVLYDVKENGKNSWKMD